MCWVYKKQVDRLEFRPMSSPNLHHSPEKKKGKTRCDHLPNQLFIEGKPFPDGVDFG
jgi:hypothetical protein